MKYTDKKRIERIISTTRKLLSYPESAEVAKFADQLDADLKACKK